MRHLLIRTVGERSLKSLEDSPRYRKIIAEEILGSLCVSWQGLASHFHISASSSPSASRIMVEDHLCAQAGEERHTALYSIVGNVIF